MSNIVINGLTYDYIGMVLIESNMPHGFGRGIQKDKYNFIEGQFNNG